MGLFELVGDLLIDPKTSNQEIFGIFAKFLENTAASVREMGVKKCAELAEEMQKRAKSGDAESKNAVKISALVPLVQQRYKKEGIGYNYRMTCLKALAAIMPYIERELVSSDIIPIFALALNDPIPNVRFCACKLIDELRHKKGLPDNLILTPLIDKLNELQNDPDKEVAYFAYLALQ